MFVVYKLTLPPDVNAGNFETQIEEVIEVEAGAEFLHASHYTNKICVWYRCERGIVKIPRTFTVVGTGHPAPSGLYIGTVIRADRVGHVFVD
jgi:hypothetical protein